MPSVGGGESAFAAAIRTGRRPDDSTVEGWRAIKGYHEARKKQLNDAASASYEVYRPRMAEVLVGQAGDAQLASHDENVQLWLDHASEHEVKAGISTEVVAALLGLQIDLDRLVDQDEPAYNAALKRGNTVEAQGILTEATEIAEKYVKDAVASIDAAGKKNTAQALDNSISSDGTSASSPSDHHEKRSNVEQRPEEAEEAGGSKADGGDQMNSNRDDHSKRTDADTGITPTADAADGKPVSPIGKRSDVPAVGAGADGIMPGQSVGPMPTPMPASPLSSGGGGSGSGASSLGGVGSGSGSLASAFKSSIPSGPSAGTSPASAIPKAATPPESFVSGLSNAGSSFQSGVASGMGASGAVSSPAQSGPPPAAMSPAQPSVAVPAATPGVPMGAGTVPESPAGASGGHSGPVGSSAPMGGGGMMPPPAAAGGGQPLAPYSPPTSSAPGGTPVSSGPASTAGAPAAPATGGAGSPAVVAGNSSSAAAGATLASTTDVNPDIAMATRVLAGLVRGSLPVGEMLQSPVSWAVAVLRTPTGPQTVVASSMGGGGYIPVTAFLPVTVRLAVTDSALPIGWADEWMGFQQPSAILAAHFERLSEVVAGVRVSAIVTSEMFPKRPRCGGDFVTVRQIDILQALAEPPVLDASHQHRLAATDLALTSRLASLGRSFTPDIAQRATAELAVRLTESVLRAASQPDETGQRLCGPAEEKLWQAIRSNTISESEWGAWASGLDTAVQMPETHAPRDPGSSVESVNARLWYRHYYRAGRVAELLTCWDARQPSSGVWDVAYCGVAAGFGPEVAEVIATIEHEHRGR